ncbi:VF530 family DNA-binding protein [Psychrobium sp. nBUS_13]|uniref:VF530 family protein n=1 Tax=Psychrobium sp. nBUS_13 TaxID=3395319 RepID=UPI003EBE6AF8
MHANSNDPLHGLTLEAVVTALVDRYGFKSLSRQIEIRCFYSDPSIKSSLKFLRKTPWARTQVEELYIKTFAKSAKTSKSSKRPPQSDKPKGESTFVWPSVKD